MRHLWTLLLAALASCAVDDSQESKLPVEDEPHSLRTSAEAYDLRFDARGHLEVDIPFTYTNATASAVYVYTCNGPRPPTLQRLEGEGWETVWTPAVDDCLGPPLGIRPGGTHANTLRLFAAVPGSDTIPAQWEGPLEGVYRLEWEVYGRWSDDDLPDADDVIPLDLRVSNAFRLR